MGLSLPRWFRVRARARPVCTPSQQWNVCSGRAWASPRHALSYDLRVNAQAHPGEPRRALETVGASVVHPGALGIDEFSSYALVIDARTAHEYREDHVPGAINLPVVDDAEFAEVGIAHARDPHAAYLVGAAYVAKNLATHIRDHISKCRPEDRILVYCFRGGKRSRAWVDTLRSIGFETDVIEGGWKRYRSWVRDGLASLAPRFEYRVLSGLTGCGKTRLLHALAHAGNQVLDLEGLASHRGSLLGALPGDPQPSQKMFDSALLDRLRRFELSRPVWVEAESRKIGNIQLPAALIDAMRKTVHLQLNVPIDERVRLLREDYAHLADNPMAMVERLLPLKALVGGEELALWKSLAEDGQVDELCRRVLQYHYDPSYRRSRQRSHGESGTIIELPAMDPQSLASAAADLTLRFGDCNPR
jgi:tRNA 2-selenouridine synthase